MADTLIAQEQIPLLTAPGPITYRPPEIPDFDKEEFRKENERFLGERQKVFEKVAAEHQKNLFSSWSEEQKANGKPVSFPSVIALQRQEESLRNKFEQASLQTSFSLKASPILTKYYTEINELQKQIDSFDKYVIAKEKERFAPLPDFAKKVEINRGGIFGENLGMRAFKDSFKESLTFGFMDGSHPVYGKTHREFNSTADYSGMILGNIAGFMIANSIAQTAQLPAKIAQLASKLPMGGKVLYSMGYAPYQLQRMESAFLGVRRLGIQVAAKMTPSAEKAATIIGTRLAAGNAISMGIINSLGRTASDLTKKYHEQDTLTKSDFKKQFPKFVWDFFEGYGMSVFGSPQTWGLRFAADGVWGMGSQLWRNVTGQQKGIIAKDFILETLLTHALGEVQGKAFSSISEKMQEQAMKDPLRKRIAELMDEDPATQKANYSNSEKLAVIEAIRMADQLEVQNKPAGGGLSEEALKAAVTTVAVEKDKIGQLRRSIESPASEIIKQEDTLQRPDYADKELYSELAIRFGWDADEMKTAMDLRMAEDPKRLLAFLGDKVEKKRKVVRVEKPDFPELQQMSEDQFRNELADLQKGWRLLSESGKLKGAEKKYADLLSRIRPEDFFIDKETGLRITKKINDQAAERRYNLEPSEINKIKEYREKVLEQSGENIPMIISIYRKLYKGKEILGGDRESELIDMATNAYEKISQMPDTAEFWIKAYRGDKKANEIFSSRPIIDLAWDVTRAKARLWVEEQDLKIGSSAKRTDKEKIKDIFFRGEEDYNKYLSIKKGLERGFRNEQEEKIYKELKERPTAAYDENAAMSELSSVGIDRELVLRDTDDTPLPASTIDFAQQNRAQLDAAQGLFFARLNALARAKPSYTFLAMLRYLKQNGMSNRAIDQHLKAMGITEFTPQQIQRLTSKVPDLLRNIDKSLKVIHVPVKTKYSKKEVDFVLSEAKSKTVRVNRTTGLFSSTDDLSFKQNLKKTGGFVFSLDRAYRVWRKREGREAADAMINRAAAIINREVNRRNADYLENKNPTGLILRNPADRASTVFVLTAQGISRNELEAIAFDINNLLRGRYNDNLANYPRKWGIALEKADGSIQGFDDFGNVRLSYVRTPADVLTAPAEYSLLHRFFPEEMDNIVFNKDNPVQAVAADNALAKIKAKDFDGAKQDMVSVVASTEQIPHAMPAIVDADILAEKARMAGMNEGTVRALKNEQKNLTETEPIEEGIRRKIEDDYDLAPGTIVSKRLRIDEQELADETRVMDALFYNTDNETKADLHNLKTEMQERGAKFEKNSSRSLADRFPRLKAFGNMIKEKLYTTPDRKWEKSEQYPHFVAQKKEEIKTYAALDITRIFKEYVVPFIKGTTPKARENKVIYFNHLFERVMEDEKYLLFKEFVNYTVNRETKARIESEPIKWNENTENLQSRIPELIKSPQFIDNKTLREIQQATADPLVFSKLLVQGTGMSADEYFHVIGKLDFSIYKPMEELLMSNYDNGGQWRDRTFGERIMDNYERIMRKIISKSGFKKFANELDFQDTEHVRAIGELLKKLPPGSAAKEGLEYFYQLWQNTDPAKLSYVRHTIIDTVDGGQTYWSEHKKIIRDFVKRQKNEHPELRGKLPGDEGLGADFKEYTGRHFRNFADAYDAGFRMEVDGFKNLIGMAQYLYTSTYNRHLADGLKKHFTKKLLFAYEPIKKIEEEFKEVSISKDLTDVQKKQKQEDLIRQKKELLPEFLRFFEGQGGFYFRPNQKTINYLSTEIKKIENDLKIVDKTNDYAAAEKLRNRARNLSQQRDALKEIQEILYGVRLTREEKSFVYQWAKTKDTKLKINDEDKAAELFRIEEDRYQYASKMASDLMALQEYMPLDAVAFKYEKKYFPKEYKFEGKPDPWHNRAQIKTAIPRMKLKSPRKMPGWEGLYLNFNQMRLMKEFLFRHKLTRSVSHYDIINEVVSKVDKMQMIGKQLILVKPTIQWINNIFSHAIATPLFKINAARFVKASNALAARHDPESPYYELYKAATRANIAQHNVGIGGMVSDYTRMFGQLMGDDTLYRRVAREILKDKLPGLTEEGAILMAKRLINNTLDTGGKLVKGWQELAWMGDEIQRIAVFDLMRERFKNYYKDQRVADYWAGRWTRKMFGDANRYPAQLRLNLGRVAMFPTYRIAMAEMWGTVFSQFAKGVKRAVGFNPKNDFMVSDKRFEQALFEAAPLLRTIAMKYAFKASTGLLLGMTSEDLWDQIFGYRVSKVEGEGINSALRYLAIGTPLFEIEKYMTRPLLLTLRYNVSFFPGLIWTLAVNRSPLDQKPMWTDRWKDDPRRCSSQLVMRLFEHYFPFAQDFGDMRAEELSMVEKLFNFSGLGYFYSTESPKKLMEDFNLATSKAITVEEHKKAMYNLNRGLRATYFRLFRREYRDAFKVLDDLKYQESRREIK